MIGKYEDMLHKNWDLTTEEQKARVELLKSQRKKLKSITFQREKLTDVWLEETTEFTQADFEIFDIPDSNVLTHHRTYLDNRFCDAAYKARMERRKEVDPEGYQIYGLGEWGEIGGLILKN